MRPEQLEATTRKATNRVLKADKLGGDTKVYEYLFWADYFEMPKYFRDKIFGILQREAKNSTAAFIGLNKEFGIRFQVSAVDITIPLIGLLIYVCKLVN